MFRYSALLALAMLGCSSDRELPTPADAASDADASDTAFDTPADSDASDTGTELDDTRPLACARPFVDHQWGTASNDEVLDLVADPAGGVYAVGYVNGTLDVADDGPTGDSRGFIRQFLRGGIGFERFVDTDHSDVVDAVAIDWDGTLHFAGRTRGAIAGATNQGAFDLLVGSVDHLGSITSLEQSGTTAPDHAMRVVMDGVGRLTIGGFTDIHKPGGAVLAWDDPFVQALSFDGTGPARPLWSWKAETGGHDRIRGLARTFSGQTFAVGALETGTDRGAIIIELAADGRLLRRTTWSPGPLESIASIKIAKDGDLIIAGSTARKLGSTQYGGQDAFIAKLAPATLETRWVTQLGRAGSEWVNDLAIGPQGSLVAVGEMLGSGTPAGDTRGVTDSFAVAISSSGAPLWSWQGAAEGEDALTSVVVDGCGDVIAGGWAVGPTSGGAHVGLRDAVVRRLPALD